MNEWPTGEPATQFTVAPSPPSADNLFGSHPGGRHKTKAYKQWANNAAWHIKLQNPQPVLDHHLAVLISGPLRIDLDNIKALLDILCMPRLNKKAVRLGIIEDDRFIDKLRIERTPPGEPLTIAIWKDVT
jgi:Holliday junction resolvase RusA-like endonuclease